MRLTAGVERAFLNALQGAEKVGPIKLDLQLRGAAKFLANTSYGMMVMCKAGASKKHQQTTVKLALDAIRAVNLIDLGGT